VKTPLAIAILLGGLITASAQDVFVLGGQGTTPIPPIVYQPPIVTGEPTVTYQPVVAAVPVYAAPVYAAPAPCASTYYNPNVIYVGGPGTCGPNYYGYGGYSAPNVIYFGRRQAYREGYSFRHCR
jgi:hypothetical protein